MSGRHRIYLAVLVLGIALAHVALWRSDLDADIKLRLTVINVAGWFVVLFPIFLVSRWLRAVEKQNSEQGSNQTP
ncbi:MAG: phenylalanyl-tRNA synthetase subunit beta [Pseudomonadota bacterium]